MVNIDYYKHKGKCEFCKNKKQCTIYIVKKYGCTVRLCLACYEKDRGV